MKLTSLQRMTLGAYREYLDSPPTWVNLFRRAWKRHLTLIGIGAIGVILLMSMDSLEAAIGIGAFTAGAFVGDIGMFRRLLLLWPALEVVLNRDRIDELLANDSRRDGLNRS